MKTLKITFAMALLLCCLSAQAQTFDQGTKVASVGIGIGSSLGGFDYSSQFPAISLSYEQGIAPAGNVGIIGIGGYLGFKGYKYETSSAGFTASSKWNYTLIGVRGALHFTGLDVDKLDLYAGLMPTYNIVNYSYRDSAGGSTGSGSYSNALSLTVFGGARYYFSENLAAFGELGYGISFLNVGLAMKF